METETTTQPTAQMKQTAPPMQAPQLSEEQIQRGIKQLYADRVFGSAEELIQALIDDQISAKAKVTQLEESNKKIFEMIESNPVLSDVLESIAQGEPFEIALAKNVDLEALSPLEGEEQYEAYRKTVESRNARKAEIAKNRVSLESNQAKSKADADEFFAQNEMDEEEQTAFLDFIETFVNALFQGEISKETLRKMYQAFRYDEAVAEASEQGQVDGRNATIEAKREKRVATDGLPNPGGAMSGETEQKPKKQIFKF